MSTPCAAFEAMCRARNTLYLDSVTTMCGLTTVEWAALSEEGRVDLCLAIVDKAFGTDVGYLCSGDDDDASARVHPCSSTLCHLGF